MREPTTFEGGSRGPGYTGDEAIEIFVDGDRHKLANELEQLAKIVRHTIGAPVSRGTIVVLWTRADR